jgi:hypothetical protein
VTLSRHIEAARQQQAAGRHDEVEGGAMVALSKP